MNEHDSHAEYQRACIEAARSLATTSLDGKDGEGGIDSQTRDAARAFLRSEFARWTQEGDEPDEQEPNDTHGQYAD